MGFHNVVLPDTFSRGYVSGPGYTTTIQVTASGHENRLMGAAQARRRFRADKRLLIDADIGALLDFHIGRRGSLYGFKILDLNDCSTAQDHKGTVSHLDHALGTADGTQTQWQLRKVYEPAGPDPQTRLLKYPVAGSVKIGVGGTDTASGWSVNETTGVVTFTSPPTASAAITAGCRFYTPVRFEKPIDENLPVTLLGTRSDLLDIALIELLDEDEFSEARRTGGCLIVDPMDNDIQLSPAEAGVYYLNPGASRNAYLPNPGTLPGGHMLDLVVDDGAVGDVTLLDDAGGTVGGPYGAGEAVRIALFTDGVTAVWRAF